MGEALRCFEGEVDTYSCPCKGNGSQPAALAMLQVLGTLITEWAAGALKCLELFATASLAELFAAQLSKLMAHYGFDGWLINIENPVLRFLLPNVLHFLRYCVLPALPALPFWQLWVVDFSQQSRSGEPLCPSSKL